jgi:hypothetical protein
MKMGYPPGMDAPNLLRKVALRTALMLLCAPGTLAQGVPDFDGAVAGAGVEPRVAFEQSGQVKPPKAPATLRYDETCILRAAARKMGVTLRADVPAPRVYLGSRTLLSQFQDAVELQWHMRPETFINVYLFERNEIYLNDDAALYGRHGRALDDSLAHKFAHYVQVRYQGADPEADAGATWRTGRWPSSSGSARTTSSVRGPAREAQALRPDAVPGHRSGSAGPLLALVSRLRTRTR